MTGRTLLRRPSSRGLLATVAAAALAALCAPVGSAQASTVVALWNMNEAAGSKVLVDSGPNHMNGTIGTSITANGAVHSFPQVVRGFNNGTFDPQHLDELTRLYRQMVDLDFDRDSGKISPDDHTRMREETMSDVLLVLAEEERLGLAPPPSDALGAAALAGGSGSPNERVERMIEEMKKRRIASMEGSQA